MPRLFALDHNFPEPIVEVLSEVQEGGEADLVSVSDIDPRMADLEDWEIMLALHHHERAWDGLITTDSSILNQPPELAVLIQTKLTLIVAMGAGDDPIKATGLLFAYLAVSAVARTLIRPRSGSSGLSTAPPRSHGMS